MDDFMEDFAAQAEQQNKELYAWEAKIEELYKRADSNLNYGINYADGLAPYKSDNFILDFKSTHNSL
jgi:hypothetical protein